jgi:hypothetical protein
MTKPQRPYPGQDTRKRPRHANGKTNPDRR